MAQATNLSEAAHTLQAHLGARFSASHAGGQQRLAAILRQQLHLGEQDARQAVAALVRRHVVDWIAEPSLSRPCPGILELCGEWVIQPDRLVGLPTVVQGHKKAGSVGLPAAPSPVSEAASF